MPSLLQIVASATGVLELWHLHAGPAPEATGPSTRQRCHERSASGDSDKIRGSSTSASRSSLHQLSPHTQLNYKRPSHARSRSLDLPVSTPPTSRHLSTAVAASGEPWDALPEQHATASPGLAGLPHDFDSPVQRQNSVSQLLDQAAEIQGTCSVVFRSYKEPPSDLR